MSGGYRNPVPGAKLPAKGDSGDWLYERSATHHHQGLDIGTNHEKEGNPYGDKAAYREALLAGKVAIRSVTDGLVVHVQKTEPDLHLPKSKRGYGRKVVIESKHPNKRWYLYAHCASIEVSKNDPVKAGQLIAYVGSSGNAAITNPHLHFEVSKQKLPTKGGPKYETKPGDLDPQARIDPRPVLYELGPYPAQEVFLVDGTKASEFEAAHERIEASTIGGFFPLGANNFWHGGVHLSVAENARLVAPFDGEIVAVRLDPDPVTATRAFGSTNFILLRHELPASVHAALQGNAIEEAAPDEEAEQADEDEALAADDALDEDDALGEDEPARVDDPYADLEEESAAPALGHDDEPSEDDEAEDEDDDDDGQAAHDADETQSEPANPERVVYSLIMHLRPEPITDALAEAVPWLTRATAKAGDSTAAQAVAHEEEKHRADLDEAKGHRLRAAVGAIAGQAADRAWVLARLRRFEIPGALAEPVELGAVIEAFQREHVHPEGSKEIDGIVTVNGKTHRRLKMTRRDLGLDPWPGPKTVDGTFFARVDDRGADGMAPVVSGLNVHVSAGEVLWRAGMGAGFGEGATVGLMPLVHWEIFAAHKLLRDGHDGWDSVEDPNDDLTADAPRTLIDLVDKSTWSSVPPFIDAPDGVITLDELIDFYRSNDAEFLRRRQVRFRTEWGLDLDATMKRLEESKRFVKVPRAELEPYQWWFHAADRLPKNVAGGVETHPWRYNPIEFLGLYQKILTAAVPAPPKDRTQFSDVHVVVLNRSAGPQGNVTVKLIDAGGGFREARTKKPSRWRIGGDVEFVDVPKGQCQLYLSYGDKAQAWSDGPLFRDVVPLADAAVEITITTQIEGEPPPTRDVQIVVRQFGALHHPPVDIWLSRTDGTAALSGRSKAARAIFTGVPLGRYVAWCPDGEADPVELEVKHQRINRRTIHRYPPRAPLEVIVSHGGGWVEGVPVVATAASSDRPVKDGEGRTDAYGRCVLALRRGWYRVRIADERRGRKVRTVEDKANHLDIALAKAPAEVAATGQLLVEVVGATLPAPLVEVLHVDAPRWVLADAPLDDDARATFSLEAGTYLVRFLSARAEATVVAGTSSTVALAL